MEFGFFKKIVDRLIYISSELKIDRKLPVFVGQKNEII